jgi:rubrerythrin
MIEPQEIQANAGDSDGDYVVFLHAGDGAKGSYRCTDCGYGVVITAALPLCPMCGSSDWEESEWSPFRRSTLL